MARKRHSAEEIIHKFREADVELAKGCTVGEVCRKLAVTEQTYDRWRKEIGGLKVDQAKRLRDLERENARLERVVAEQVLDNAILREAASGNSRVRSGDARSPLNQSFGALPRPDAPLLRRRILAELQFSCDPTSLTRPIRVGIALEALLQRAPRPWRMCARPLASPSDAPVGC